MESLEKLVPVTVSVMPCVPQYGAEEVTILFTAREVIEGGAPGGVVIENRTRFDIAVVVVLLIFVPLVADPGISTATCTVPGVVSNFAGTRAVS